MRRFMYYVSTCLLLVGLSFYSCSDVEDMIEDNNSSNAIETRVMGDNQYQVLGYGYDITGEYLARNSIKDIVLDMSKIYAAKPQVFRKEFVGETSSETYIGEDFMSYLKEIVKKNNFKGSVAERPREAKFDENKRENIPYSFSASFNSESTNKTSVSTRYSFARVDVLRKHRQYFLNAQPQDVVSYLSEGFKRDLNQLSPDALVLKYGTHVLLDFTIGGTYSAYYKSTITENTSFTSKSRIVEGGIAAALGKIGVSFNTSLSKAQIEEYTRKNSSWNCNVYVRGGQDNGQVVTINSNGTYGQTLNIGSWLNTVDDYRCVLADINFNRTYPIYEFITDLTKKQQLKDAVVRYLISKEKKVVKTKPMHQLKSRNTGDTWWVYTMDEVNEAVSRWNDEYHGVVGFVLAEPESNTRPLYRLKSRNTGDTWYTYDWASVQYAVAKWNEIYGGIDGYVYSTEQPNSRPLYRLKSRKSGDTWYAYDWATVQYAIAKWNEIYGGIDGYILK